MNSFMQTVQQRFAVRLRHFQSDEQRRWAKLFASWESWSAHIRVTLKFYVIMLALFALVMVSYFANPEHLGPVAGETMRLFLRTTLLAPYLWVAAVLLVAWAVLRAFLTPPHRTHTTLMSLASAVGWGGGLGFLAGIAATAPALATSQTPLSLDPLGVLASSTVGFGLAGGLACLVREVALMAWSFPTPAIGSVLISSITAGVGHIVADPLGYRVESLQDRLFATYSDTLLALLTAESGAAPSAHEWEAMREGVSPRVVTHDTLLWGLCAVVLITSFTFTCRSEVNRWRTPVPASGTGSIAG
ncbi:hypothetical protein ET989_00535 [Propioniciclava sinopodophylli]|uniref:Uncharacterized protein n=1 Tax=Propioniciclava sinopodophylli TaxID=1837344 RepID=A0A4Q9KGT3_9ACTN|nr:hypothetical protein [Propioniciclava sinopodophylli]TBT88481.1 hypothetical protein ET989_00535 [Propioniciclava sinopodophylli]